MRVWIAVQAVADSAALASILETQVSGKKETGLFAVAELRRLPRRVLREPALHVHAQVDAVWSNRAKVEIPLIARRLVRVSPQHGCV